MDGMTIDQMVEQTVASVRRCCSFVLDALRAGQSRAASFAQRGSTSERRAAPDPAVVGSLACRVIRRL
jgi:hypothetical protein